MVGSAKVRATVGFGPWHEEELVDRIERLRLAFENHERVLSELDERFDAEESARRWADERQDRALGELRNEFTDMVRDAAAGGLRLQTFGVLLFAVGVVLGTWGNLAS
jgi:hypothetical protein